MSHTRSPSPDMRIKKARWRSLVGEAVARGMEGPTAALVPPGFATPRRQRPGAESDETPAEDHSCAILSQQLWLAKLLEEDALREAGGDAESEASSVTPADSQAHTVRELMGHLQELSTTVRHPPADSTSAAKTQPCTRSRAPMQPTDAPHVCAPCRRLPNGTAAATAASRPRATTWRPRTSSTSCARTDSHCQS